MPRRELLTELQRLAVTEPATEEREMARHYTLGNEDWWYGRSRSARNVYGTYKRAMPATGHSSAR